MSLIDHEPRVEQARSAGMCFSDGLMLPEMVVIPPGGYWMGSDGGGSSERPRHLINIKYWMAVSRYPVTFEQWDAFSEGDSTVHRPDDQGWGRGRLPVCDVSWEDAISYVRWLSIAAGRAYRLPSESEWEYCCRAGSAGDFSTGEQINVKEANFLYSANGERTGVGRPVTVGSYPRNAMGLYDMHGNVREVVADVWHESYEGAPADGSAWEPYEAAMWRVVRGGGWDGKQTTLRASFRERIQHTQRLINMGFRVACTLD
jgi:formylglycine-generating enzyme required for sulfatase activity